MPESRLTQILESLDQIREFVKGLHEECCKYLREKDEMRKDAVVWQEIYTQVQQERDYARALLKVDNYKE